VRTSQHKRVEDAASALRDLLATRSVAPHLLTVGFAENPPRLHVYVRRHGFAQDIPDRFKNIVVETHYTHRVTPG
jgi:hypothetical protein